MTIMTNSGKKFDADWMLDTETRHGAHQLVIQLPGYTLLEDIMTDIVGTPTITSIKDNGVRTVYEGYSTLASLIYSADRKNLRVTLEKGETA